MKAQRLDTLLVQLNLCSSRQQAQSLIRAGSVKVNQHVLDKPGSLINPKAQIEIASKPPYVSRGGEKLAKALQVFNIDVLDRVCLDGGISTGGFSDCLLQAGAKLIYGIDVGYGQLAWSLRQDPRIILKERTNFRYLIPTELYGELEKPDLGVMDLSFISLTKVLPTLWQLLLPPREVLLLVKPQFEVGKDMVGKNGVVRHPESQADAIFTVQTMAISLGWKYRGLTWSPITGPAGNVEFLLWLRDDGDQLPLTRSAIEAITREAIASFTATG